jgi:hypothetical protein
MFEGNLFEKKLLRSELSEYSIEAIAIFTIVYHGAIVLKVMILLCIGP